MGREAGVAGGRITARGREGRARRKMYGSCRACFHSLVKKRKEFHFRASTPTKDAHIH
jgi:hypothetical protein